MFLIEHLHVLGVLDHALVAVLGHELRQGLLDPRRVASEDCTHTPGVHHLASCILIILALLLLLLLVLGVAAACASAIITVALFKVVLFVAFPDSHFVFFGSVHDLGEADEDCLWLLSGLVVLQEAPPGEVRGTTIDCFPILLFSELLAVEAVCKGSSVEAESSRGMAVFGALAPRLLLRLIPEIQLFHISDELLDDLEQRRRWLLSEGLEHIRFVREYGLGLLLQPLCRAQWFLVLIQLIKSLAEAKVESTKLWFMLHLRVLDWLVGPVLLFKHFLLLLEFHLGRLDLERM